MKKTSTTIILIVLIIGLIGSGVALYIIQRDKENEQATSNPQVSSTISVTQDGTDIENVESEKIELPSEENNSINSNSKISVNEIFNKLYEYYGNSYQINCIDKNASKPIFNIIDNNTNEHYAKVCVDLNTAIATETIEKTKEIKEFSLFG